MINLDKRLKHIKEMVDEQFDIDMNFSVSVHRVIRLFRDGRFFYHSFELIQRDITEYEL